jgi:hypothetical protein
MAINSMICAFELTASALLLNRVLEVYRHGKNLSSGHLVHFVLRKGETGISFFRLQTQPHIDTRKIVLPFVSFLVCNHCFMLSEWHSVVLVWTFTAFLLMIVSTLKAVGCNINHHRIFSVTEGATAVRRSCYNETV